MIFEQIPVGQMQNFSYLIGDETTKEAAAVDPAWEVDKITERIYEQAFFLYKDYDLRYSEK